jgi:hypothetical protein
MHPTMWVNLRSTAPVKAARYQELKKLNPSKIGIPMKKWAHELNREFSKKEIQMAVNT